MDLLERLNDTINEVDELPLKSILGYLGANESLAVYPLAGSNVVETYMNEVTVEDHNFEVAMKSKSEGKIDATLWKITRAMQKVKDIKSSNESFKFETLTITNMPFINQADDSGSYVFLMDIRIRIENHNKGE